MILQYNGNNSPSTKVRCNKFQYKKCKKNNNQIIDVKLESFKSFYSLFYCCYLWTAHKKSIFDKLRVAFNNAYRRVLNLPWRCSASAM